MILDVLARMSDDLPALQIVAPLLAAAVCLVVRRARAAWAVAMVVAWGSFVSACVLLSRVLTHGTISYAEGGWQPPWGIELRIDLLNALIYSLMIAPCPRLPRSAVNGS